MNLFEGWVFVVLHGKESHFGDEFLLFVGLSPGVGNGAVRLFFITDMIDPLNFVGCSLGEVKSVNNEPVEK